MPETAWIALVLVIGLVVIVNLSLWFMWRNRGVHDQIQILRRSGKALRRPWEREDAALEELSKRVDELQRQEKDKGND